MPRDYVKRVPHRRSRHRPKKNLSLWLLAIALAIIFGLALIYLKHKEATKSIEAHRATSKPVTTKSVEHFDFYTVLPKLQLPNSAAQAPTKSTHTDTSQLHSDMIYILQLGDFDRFTSADELRAQLTLQGFEAHLTAIQSNQTRYRVWIGPFLSYTEAKNQQKNLEANQIHSQINSFKGPAQ